MEPFGSWRIALLGLALVGLTTGCEAQISGYPTHRQPLGGGPTAGPGGIHLMGDAGSPSYDAGQPIQQDASVPPGPGSSGPGTGPGAQPPPSVTPFPSGPYGVESGAVMNDYQFQRVDGAMTRLSEIRADMSVKVIVWVSSVEWCTYCRAQVPLLNQIATMPGVRVISSLYETQSYSPATTSTAQSWDSSLGCNYDVIVEQNPPHTPHTVNPTAWIIDAETMQIRDRFNGEEPQLMNRVQTAVNGARR